MSNLAKRLIDRSFAFNNRFAEILANGSDWMFRRDSLVLTGRSWFELVYDSDLMCVRYYDLPDESSIELPDGSEMPINRNRHDVPLILVPPLGVTSDAFDLMPNRSLVNYMSAAGFKTYMIDWGSPEEKHNHLDLNDYAVKMLGRGIEAVREHSGCQEISLMGWCMGGLLALTHQGRVKDPHIRNIVTVASPINFQSGGVVGKMGQALNAQSDLIGKLIRGPLRALDDVSKLSMGPKVTTWVFKMTSPMSSITGYWDLLSNLWDREFVENHTTTSNYLNNMRRYPGGMMRDITVKMAMDNQLSAGTIDLGNDEVAELSSVKSAFLGFSGSTDSMVPTSSAQQIMSIIGSEDKSFLEVKGGHMGVILGSKAINSVWEPSATWLAERSQAPSTEET